LLFFLSNHAAVKIFITQKASTAKLPFLKIHPAWGIDEKIKKHLTIVRNDNLNLYPELKTPMNQRELHTFRWFSLKNGFCSFSITIPHRDFSSGQAIPVKMEINNMSQVDIAKTKVTLKTIFTFTCLSFT
jgi:hypothetical protein